MPPQGDWGLSSLWLWFYWSSAGFELGLFWKI